MPKTMPNSTAEEKYRWIKPILDRDISIKNMVKVCPFSERAIKYWLANFRKNGLAGLENKSTRPKTHPKETPIRIKERIIELRRENKKCAFKLVDDLAQEGIEIDARTIGKILKVNGLTRKYRVKKITYKYIKVPLRAGELVEIDIKYVPSKIKGKQYYQFTVIDGATRWRYLEIYEDTSNSSAIDFLLKAMRLAPFQIKAVKTDNGSCFTNRYTGYQKSADPFNPKIHAFDLKCQKENIIHYLIDPGKPAQNGKVERSHRSDQESFYDQNTFTNLEELKYKLRLWNMYYNDLQHCGLNNLSPNQALSLRGQNVRS